MSISPSLYEQLLTSVVVNTPLSYDYTHLHLFIRSSFTPFLGCSESKGFLIGMTKAILLLKLEKKNT